MVGTSCEEGGALGMREAGPELGTRGPGRQWRAWTGWDVDQTGGWTDRRLDGWGSPETWSWELLPTFHLPLFPASYCSSSFCFSSSPFSPSSCLFLAGVKEWHHLLPAWRTLTPTRWQEPWALCCAVILHIPSASPGGAGCFLATVCLPDPWLVSVSQAQ